MSPMCVAGALILFRFIRYKYTYNIFGPLVRYDFNGYIRSSLSPICRQRVFSLPYKEGKNLIDRNM